MRMRRRRSSRNFGCVIGLIILLGILGAIAFLGRAYLNRDGGVPNIGSIANIGGVISSATPTPSRPDPQQVARQFFQSWERGQYDEMYGMLSEFSRAEISQERFVTRYRNINSGVGITAIAVDLRTPQAGNLPAGAQATEMRFPYAIAIDSSRIGKVADENEVKLILEGDRWKVDWSPSLIFKGLTADNSVRLLPDDPIRASIVDRNGKPLATLGHVLSIGVIPGFIKEEEKVLTALSGYLGMKPEAIKAAYANARPDWWVPLRELPLDRLDDAKAKLGGIPGINLREKEARVYPNGSIGAHVVGYVSEVNADDLKNLASKGYEEGDVIGRSGIEAWADETLGGQKGGKLVIATSDGVVVRTIGERKAKQGETVQLTIDIDVQRKAEEALGDKTGSIVVMDPRDNSILALVSHPSFDPNSFILGISDADWKKLSEDKRMPFQNRTVASAYPTGSIFKVITMAAGMEKGGFTPNSQFNSTGQWTLPGTNQVFRDWVPQGHGRLNLVDGLAQSCNIVFYDIGFKLETNDSNILPSFARAFGLGEPTGLVGLREVAGTVPDPAWKRKAKGESWYPGDAVNLAIGQGYFEASPIQMANVYSTLASGGNLRTPLLVKRLGDGTAAREMAAEQKAKPSLSAATLAAIREGMKRTAADPKGTANYAFKGFRVPTAAKTGSAENQNPDAHAWFAGYAPADNPEVVIIVMVEGGRAGGEVAAPLGRRVLEGYFTGR